ncbi:MAG: very short patch repair endonuclease [Methanothrix sp.]|nr:very short patch repair endonuclease [Methanothrix sp.]MDD4448700.1 very short patch repair endonuclease [Methanothrix sp.]
MFSKEMRSKLMSRVSGKNTKPEIVVRKILHELGFRYRLHVSKLPGHPDIVLPKHKKIILVNGCFWHGHKDCRRSKRPHTNAIFWNKKIDDNIARDNKTIDELKLLGWDVLVIWQCQLNDIKKIKIVVLEFLGGDPEIGCGFNNELSECDLKDSFHVQTS